MIDKTHKIQPCNLWQEPIRKPEEDNYTDFSVGYFDSDLFDQDMEAYQQALKEQEKPGYDWIEYSLENLPEVGSRVYEKGYSGLEWDDVFSKEDIEFIKDSNFYPSYWCYADEHDNKVKEWMKKRVLFDGFELVRNDEYSLVFDHESLEITISFGSDGYTRVTDFRNARELSYSDLSENVTIADIEYLTELKMKEL